MIHPIFELTEWLEGKKGNTILINKGEFLTGMQEISDSDQIKLFLDNVTIKTIERHDQDDYLADQELILYGDGKIISDEGEFDLPQSVYEIPLMGNLKMEHEDNGVLVTTERATYTIRSN
ncbi:hypothetical protein [Evansella tamaricis]|uniref:Uncharacterized protein n=1 Tax=Evansella tamaricis TaxID=2069301 RepID=A0ABS6JDC6_9BACI|nr:hypothetical protein [Evansella tamaricis]MBU9711420.1 hypothetical protein [Evansella tamaricis]